MLCTPAQPSRPVTFTTSSRSAHRSAVSSPNVRVPSQASAPTAETCHHCNLRPSDSVASVVRTPAYVRNNRAAYHLGQAACDNKEHTLMQMARSALAAAGAGTPNMHIALSERDDTGLKFIDPAGPRSTSLLRQPPTRHSLTMLSEAVRAWLLPVVVRLELARRDAFPATSMPGSVTT